jgi:hypothetical protein
LKGCHIDVINNRQKFAVTTSHRPSPDQFSLAVKIAAELSAPFIPRNDLSIDALRSNLGVSGMVIVSSNRISFFTGVQSSFSIRDLPGFA